MPVLVVLTHGSKSGLQEEEGRFLTGRHGETAITCVIMSFSSGCSPKSRKEKGWQGEKGGDGKRRTRGRGEKEIQKGRGQHWETEDGKLPLC